MATRSRIGIQIGNDILSAYHHWDGYPEWLGRILKTHYNTKEKVAELIDGGDMSVALGDDKKPEYYADRCLLYTSPSPRDATLSRMPSSA